MFQLKRLLFVGCLPLMANAAQMTPTETIELEPIIVVTGTLTEKTLEKSPVPIHVIDRQAIEESGSTQLDELLEDVPGLVLVNQHGQQGQTVLMQGMDSRYVVFLIDGVPVSQTTDEINIERLMLNNIERIEVVPGGSSALYGSNAMGGVINLITHKSTENYLQGSISVEQTESDVFEIPTSLNASINSGRSFGDLYLNNALSLTRYSAVNIDPNTITEDQAAGYRWNLSEVLRWDTYSATFDWTGGRLERAYLQEKANNSYAGLKTENSDEFSLKLQRKKQQSQQLLLVSYDNYETIQDLKYTSEEDFSRDASAYGFNGSSHWTSLWHSHEITTGFDSTWESLDQQSITQNEVDNQQGYGSSAFIQDDWNAVKNVEIISGLRTQWDNGFGWFLSPKIAIRWDAIDTGRHKVYLRSSIGLGYRTPSLKELYYEFDHSQYGYKVIGNSELDPEQSLSGQLEIGGESWIGWQPIEWSVNFFRQDVSQLITTELDNTLSNGLSNYVYANIDEALISGIDATLSIPFTLGSTDLEWKSSYNFLSAKDTTNNMPLNQRPTHQFSEKIRAQFSGRFKPVLNLQWKYTGEQYVDNLSMEGYHSIDIATVLSLTEKIRLQFGVENLTNQYSNSTNNTAMPTLGRTWRIALNF